MKNFRPGHGREFPAAIGRNRYGFAIKFIRICASTPRSSESLSTGTGRHDFKLKRGAESRACQRPKKRNSKPLAAIQPTLPSQQKPAPPQPLVAALQRLPKTTQIHIHRVGKTNSICTRRQHDPRLRALRKTAAAPPYLDRSLRRQVVWSF